MSNTATTKKIGDYDLNWATPEFISSTREYLSENLKLSIDEVPLGAGYSGVVYRVGRDKALKVLRPLDNLTPDFAESLLRRFYFEAEVLQRGQEFTEATPRIYQAGKFGPHNYILMEQLHPKTLKLIASNPDKYRLIDKVKIAGDLTKHLHDMHLNDIIHRDIKPGNITFCRGTDIVPVRGNLNEFLGGRNIKLIDFGCASLLSKVAEEEGYAIGTPAYMAPEQAFKNLTEIGSHTEQYNLAATLYRLVTGETPDILDIRSDLKTGGFYVAGLKPLDIPPISNRRERALMDILRKALSKHPESRYGSMEKFNHEFRDFFEWSYPNEVWPESATIEDEDAGILRKTGHLFKNGLKITLRR